MGWIKLKVYTSCFTENNLIFLNTNKDECAHYKI